MIAFRIKHNCIKVCANADGEYMPLYVIYKGKNLYSSWLNGPPSTHYQCSTNGWMESTTFLDWFKCLFLEHVDNIKGPKVLILDGHSSHLSLEVVLLAKENNVSIICLPAHTTHILQPLDVAVFAPMKRAWGDIIEKHNQKSYNINKTLFPELLNKLVNSKKAFLRRHAVAGFEASGLYPLNQNAISDEKLKKCIHQANIIDEPENNGEDYGGDDGEDKDGDDDGDDVGECELVAHGNVSEDGEYGRDDDDGDDGGDGGDGSNSFYSQDKATNRARSQIVITKRTNIAEQFVDQSLRAVISSQQNNNTQKKRKRLIGPSGACITSQESIAILELESQSKKQKLLDIEVKKKEREEKKLENERKKEWNAVKKQNKSRKICGCDKKMTDDKENKGCWLSCFKCSTWCCYECVPQVYKMATNRVYVCRQCSNEQ